TFDYDYAAAGVYYPQVELTDNEGALGFNGTAVVVNPGAYDEVEDNDSQGTANTLPALPFGEYYGNAGPDGGNDGDLEDFFTFSANAGDEVTFHVEYSWSGGTDLNAQMEDASGLILASSFGYPPQPL
ncbi:MAG: hypothetical protein M3R04_02090, partial [bacterium]|nr:hypothetical protein [bacterium]